MKQNSRLSLCLNRGFSLIELLVVVSIVGVLTILGFAASSRIRKSADAARCANNLRQIAYAIHQYVQENNNTMPGPLLGAQRPYTAPFYAKPNTVPDNNLTRQMALIDRLVPYIGLTTKPGSSYQPQETSYLFVCPAGRKLVKSQGLELNDGRYYNTILDPQKPFGYWGSANSFTLPKKVSELESWSSLILLVDNDDALRPSPVAPYKPAHGTVRNVLYLDGHVSAVPLDELE